MYSWSVTLYCMHLLRKSGLLNHTLCKLNKNDGIILQYIEKTQLYSQLQICIALLLYFQADK